YDRKKPARGFGPRDLIARAWLFTAGTGKAAHTLPGLFPVGTADLDGDGLPDLYGLRQGGSGQPDRLHAFRGGPPESWRRLAPWPAAAAGTPEEDPRTTSSLPPPPPPGALDGDGPPDLLAFRTSAPDDPPEPPLRAYSGKDGRTLWKAGGVQGTLRGGYN